MAIVLFLCYGSSLFHQLLKLVAQIGSIFTFIHFVNDLLPLPVFNLGILYRFAFLTYFLFTFLRILLSQDLSEHIGQALFDMSLYKPKLFITFIFENLGKKSNLMIVSQICLNSSYQCTRPFYYQRLQAILLIEVGVHELLHGLDSQGALSAFLVVFYLLRVHVTYHVFQLFQWDDLERQLFGSCCFWLQFLICFEVVQAQELRLVLCA